MANEANKKQLVRNASYLKNLMYQIILCNVSFGQGRHLLACDGSHLISAHFHPCAELRHAARLPQTIYALYRIWFLWESFSSWHIVAEVVMLLMYVLMYRFLASEASPKHAPLSQVKKAGPAHLIKDAALTPHDLLSA